MSVKVTDPAAIERASMDIIRAELADRGIVLPPENQAVVLRAIHATADFDFAANLTFTPGAVQKAVAALKAGADIVTDTNMARAGVSKAALGKLGGGVYCYMADETVAARARAQGITRAAVSMQAAARERPAAVYAVGNAPTALLALCALLEQGLRPALIVGAPVGFVNVVESKEMLLETCERHAVPAIVAMGRKGGSTVAAAICNALLYTAAGTLDPRDR